MHDDDFYDSLPYLPTLYMESNELSGHKRNCADGAGGDCTCGKTPIEWFQGEQDEFIGPVEQWRPAPFVPASCCETFPGCDCNNIPF